MKTNRLSMFKIAGLVAGITAAIACVGKSAALNPAGTPTPTAPVVSPVALSTNSAGVTNASSNTRAPLAKIAPSIPTSPGLGEIVKLAQSGVEPDVLLSYVDNSKIAYNPTADEIIYLHDVGITPKVVTAIVEHGKRLREQDATAVQTTPATVATPSAAVPNPPPADALPYHPGYPAASPSYNVPAPAAPLAPAELPPQVDQFYGSLAPYGTWYDLPDYGWAWQPTVAVAQPGWRPYCDYGRWLDSDCGWYWQSDYSWGWAPFHYGRWCNYGGLGWTWIPGSVWGPSWVCWRNSPLYCGWAPLPPAAVFGLGGFSYFGVGVGAGFGFGLGVADFTFVPFNHFCAWNLTPFCLSPVFAGGIFNQTTVNHRYFQGPNGRIMNLGVDPARVAAATRSEIPKVTVRDLTPAAGKLVKPDRLERDGSSFVVYRPQPQNNLPAKPGGQSSYHRQAQAPQATALSTAATTPTPVAALPQSAARSSSATAMTPPNLVPVVRLPYAAQPSTGGASPPEDRRDVGSVAKRIEARPSSIRTTPLAWGAVGSGIPGSPQSFHSEKSAAVQPAMPFLGRYPTQAAAARSAASYSGARTGAASLPLPAFRNESAPLVRQKVSKSAFGEMRSASPSAWSRPGPLANVRPPFYSAPPIAQPPGRPAYESAPYNSRSAPARPAPAPLYYSRPQAPSASFYRGPSYSATPRYARPSYSAPSYSHRPSYTPAAPSYSSRPSYAPSYHSSGGYSGGFGSGGRSSGGSFSSRSNR